MEFSEIERPQGEFTPITQELELDSLLDLLARASVPVETYGTGNAKTVPHLLAEIEEGESTLLINGQGELLRQLRVLWVDVIHRHDDGSIFLLKEAKQVFKDGREKQRSLDSSIGEKLKPHEEPQAAVTRALQEELGITSEVEAMYYLGDEQSVRMPNTFPGLPSQYQFFKYSVVIASEDYVSEGYIEYQSDKTNYYTWDKIQ